jgi:hypothetical protein
MPPKTKKNTNCNNDLLTSQLSIDHSVHFYKKIEEYIATKQPDILLNYIDELEQQTNEHKLQTNMLQRRISAYIAETISMFALCEDEIGLEKLKTNMCEIYEIIGIIATYTPQKLTFISNIQSFQTNLKENLEAWKQEAQSQNWHELLNICEKLEAQKHEEETKKLKTQMKKMKLSKAQLRQYLEEMSDDSS